MSLEAPAHNEIHNGEFKASFCWPLRVYYEDTDATGVVYHANYLKYFERGRTEWLRSLGLGQTQLREGFNLAFAVVSAQIAFKRPARLDDEIEVFTRISKMQRASLEFSQSLRKNETLLATGHFRVACISADQFKLRALPSALSSAFSTQIPQEPQ